ncbi:MAG TPA: hypothetical protein ENK26_01780, partial [Gammaproteobacteria bacterium]|nr:hypothetical protein [Gammaproteobacteria bacterium]
MISFLKAIVILLFCIGASAMAIRFIDRQRNMMPHVVIWSILSVVIFLTQSYPLVMAILILVKALYLKNDVDKNISMFLSLMVVMPFSFLFKLVPGINLIDVAIIQMLTIVFFLPLVYRILRDESFHLHHPDILAMALMSLLLFNAFRVTTEYEFTWFQTVRDFIDTLLVVVIPYFVISRGLRRFASLDNALAGLLFGGLTMAFFSVFEEALQWRPYVEIGSIVGTMPDLESMYEYRGGFLRVTATLTGPITFGFYLTIVLAALMYFLRKNRISPLIQAMAVGFFLMIMLFTGSRSALLGGLLYTALYVLFSLRRRFRRVLLVPVILAAVVGGVISEAHSPGPKQTANLEQVDQYGTFDYRKKLFFTAIRVIPDHLWFGTRMYRGDYRM